MDEHVINAMDSALIGLRDSQAAVEAAVKALQEQDMAKENADLRNTISRLNAQLQESREETAALRGAHEELSRSFKHELASKRLTMLGITRQQHQAYLNTGLERERERLNLLNREMQNNMSYMSAELNKVETAERTPLYAELNALRSKINFQADETRKRLETYWKYEADRQAYEMGQLGNTPIDNAALGAVRKFFAWETFWGLKIISIIGALLLLLGVFTFGRYLYMTMGPVLQLIAIFFLGLALMGTGEALFRKKWRGGISLALTASGSGMLFLGAALGHMTLGVLPMWAALAACAIASALSFVAAIRYNAQLVSIFALVGGYLPIIALSESIVLFSAIYFTTLNLLALLLATRKNWKVMRFIGLGSGLMAQIVMMNVSLGKLTDISVIAIIGISIAIGFITYLIIPVFGAWFTKTSIKAADIILLSCNLLFGFLTALWWGTAYAPTSILLWRDHTDIVAAIITAFFALSCIIMALTAELKKRRGVGVPDSETGSLRALFFITSIAFSALSILFLLNAEWLFAGWLVQSVGLSLYGIYRNRSRFIISGSIIGAICLLAFLIVNVPQNSDPLFVWQYLSITLAAVIVSTGALKLKAKTPSIRALLNIFRACAVINLWGYVIYALHDPLFTMLTQAFGRNASDFAALLSCLSGFAAAFILPRIKRLYNSGFLVASIIIGFAGTIGLVVFNAQAHGVIREGSAISITAFSLFIISNLIAVGWMYDILRYFTRVHKFNIKWTPLIFSGSAVFLLTQNLVVQLSLRPSSLILTLIFGLTAMGWVLFGFLKRNRETRVSGLIMAFVAVIKLFLLDLSGLDTMWRVISYFSGGAVLLLISFTYQWFNKKLESEEKSQN